jgi:hypothetical protein
LRAAPLAPKLDQSKGFKDDMTDFNCGEPLRLDLPARVGRKDGTLVEFDRCGARVRHSGALKLGGELQLSFKVAGEVFAAISQVLACRVVGLGLGEGGSTLFESKLNFIDERTRDIAERMLGVAQVTPTA